jgi:hypothetical protein
VGDVEERPFGVSLDGQRGERRSNVFSRLVDILRFVVDEFCEFDRIIVELKVAQRYRTVRKERNKPNMSFEICCCSARTNAITL